MPNLVTLPPLTSDEEATDATTDALVALLELAVRELAPYPEKQAEALRIASRLITVFDYYGVPTPAPGDLLNRRDAA